MTNQDTRTLTQDIPNWVSRAAQMYLAHTEAGMPIRALARATGCHASTILRQIRRVETRRDDPLVDAALRSLGTVHFRSPPSSPTNQKVSFPMSFQEKITSADASDIAPDSAHFMSEAARVLRRLCETGAVLAVATNMEKAVVVRDGVSGTATRTGVVGRDIAEAMALKEWISPKQTGKITRYTITPAGRAAVEDILLDSKTRTAGFAESQTPYADQHRVWGERTITDGDTGQPRRMRYNLAESPLTALARRRDKNGEAFLTDDLVRAGERLCEDFELAQMGPRVAQNWERFLTGGGRGNYVPDSGVMDGPSNARKRVAEAMDDLGPGLSDVVLRCCCYLEGLETAEKLLGWSARSGKIVLRIALTRLKRHYDETVGPGGPLIG